MKDPRFLFSLLVIVGLGALGFAEWRTIQDLQKQVAELKEAAASQAATNEGEIAKLKKQIDDRTQVIAQMEEQRKNEKKKEAEAVEVAASADAPKEKPKTPDFGSMMKKMFQDPEMKKMMKGTQAMAVRMMYSDLAKELGIKQDDANKVMEILGERQMAMASKGMAMLGGDSEVGAAKEDVATSVEAESEQYNQQLESILGKDGMAKLNEYERTLADRAQIQQYKQAFAANGLPLDDQESTGLLTIMKEERLKQPPSPLEPGAKDVGAAVTALQSDEVFNKIMTDQEDANRRVLSRARNVLSPDKMAQFESIQKQHLDQQRMGLEFGRKFLNPK